jgi:hypothetical protein
LSFLNDIRNAVLGWLDLLGSGKGVAGRFNPTREGLVNALVFYAIVMLATMAIQSIAVGSLPTYDQVFLGLGLNGLPLAGVAIAIYATRLALRLPATFLTLFVPASYALAFVILVGLPLALMFGNLFSNAMLGILGYMLFRLGRVIGPMKLGAAIAFAAFAVVALVLVPVGLYMVTVPAPPAP